jgi:predicted MFS family arabinose efflux permease
LIEEAPRPKKLMTLSFIVSSFATQPAGLITSLLLIEIGLTFGVSVGVAGQLRTVSSIVGVLVALLLGVISLRYSSRSLLLTGSVLLVISAVGCAFAWDFTSMLVIFSLTGVGVTMIAPMINTLIGENFPKDKRSRILGLSAAGTSIAFLVCSPLVSYISGVGGWRLVFLLLMLPVSIVGLAMAFIGIPKSSQAKKSTQVKELLSGFRSVLSDSSAVFCLIGTMLTWTSFLGSLTYSISFFREQFSLALGWASILLSAMALSKTVGHLTISSLIGKLGRKNAAVASIVSMAILTFCYLFSSIFWLSVAIVCVSCTLAGYMHSSVDSLNLEQVPEYRSSMQSLSYAFYTLGGVMGAGLGGFALVFGGYHILGVLLGIFGVASGIVLYVFAREPTN